jgi:hypothetical protein
MIECGRSPTVCRVALRARMVVAPRRMIWIRRAIVVRKVTGVAIRRETTAVLPVHMTQAAVNRWVDSGQRKCCGGVAERRRLPGRCVVTLRACMAKLIRGVVWTSGSVEITLVARIAVNRRA